MADLRRERLEYAPIEAERAWTNVVYWLLALVLGAGLLFLVWRVRPRIDLQATPLLLERTLIKVGIRPPKTLRRWVRFAALPPLSKSYLEINRALSRLGRKPVVNQTPTERADNLGQSLPEARIPANHLVHEYQLAIFSKQPANEVAALKAGKQIRSLSLKAYMQRLFARLQRRPGRTRPRF